MSETEKLYPDPVPDGETAVAENPAFVSACMSVVSCDAAAMGWRLGNSILTHSEMWGFMFRIDFQTKYHTQNSEFVNRYICWSAEEDSEVMGTAVVTGQRLIKQL